MYKEKILELEDNVYETEQTLNNCFIFHKLFLKLAKIMIIDITSIPKLEKSKRGFGFCKENKKKIESKSMRESLFEDQDPFIAFNLNKLLESHEIKINDLNNNNNNQILFKEKEFKSSLSSLDNNVMQKISNTNNNFEKNLLKKRKKIKIKNLLLLEKLKINRILSTIKENDIIFLLNKIKNYEDQFPIFKFLSKQSESNFEDLNLKYTIIKNKNFYSNKKNNDKIKSKVGILDNLQKKSQKDKNNQIICFKNNSSNKHLKNEKCSIFESNETSKSMYEYLTKEIQNSNYKLSNKNIKIIVSKHQRRILFDYIQTNIQIISQRINNLKQIKNFRNKEKNKISEIASDFMYDQQIVNNLTINFNKIENDKIEDIFNILEGEENDNDETQNEDKNMNKSEKSTFFEYNQNYLFCLKQINNNSSKNIYKLLK